MATSKTIEKQQQQQQHSTFRFFFITFQWRFKKNTHKKTQKETATGTSLTPYFSMQRMYTIINFCNRKNGVGLFVLVRAYLKA